MEKILAFSAISPPDEATHEEVALCAARGGGATLPTNDNPQMTNGTECREYSVLLFGGLQEAAGAEKISLRIAKSQGEAGISVEDLRSICAREFPQLARWMPYVAVAVNREYSQAQTRVFPGDEIALLPPVAGGSTQFPRAAILETVLDESSLRAALERETAGGVGAVISFVGVVRDNARDNEGHPREVESLEYSAYQPMAVRALEKIIDEVRARYNAVCLVHHRVGRLAIGEASVVIMVASAHRGAAFEGCRYAIEALKRDVPIWKKEFARDGSYWVAGPPCEYSQAASSEAEAVAT